MRPVPASKIFYVDKATGIRLCEACVPPPPRPPRYEGVLEVQPVLLQPAASPSQSTMGAALQEVDRLFAATSAIDADVPDELLPLFISDNAALRAHCSSDMAGNWID